MTSGNPGRVTPAAWKPGAIRSVMYQVSGSRRVRCISFARSGLPEAVCEPAITQLLEPDAQPGQVGWPRRATRAVVLSELASAGEDARTTAGGDASATRGTARDSVFSSSSSFPGAGGKPCGCERSSLTPVGGWSRQDPTG